MTANPEERLELKVKMLELLKRGLNDVQIARTLDNVVSHDTVRRYRIRLEGKELLKPRLARRQI